MKALALKLQNKFQVYYNQNPMEVLFGLDKVLIHLLTSVCLNKNKRELSQLISKDQNL